MTLAWNIKVQSQAVASAVSGATAWSYMTQAHILQSKKKPTRLIWFNETTSSPQNRWTSPRPQVEHMGESTEKDRWEENTGGK